MAQLSMSHFLSATDPMLTFEAFPFSNEELSSIGALGEGEPLCLLLSWHHFWHC
jgi:hypothetical protein